MAVSRFPGTVLPRGAPGSPLPSWPWAPCCLRWLLGELAPSQLS